ncbi:MAG: tetratricopeptide repeat protein [Acidobacteriota bacterium]
MAAKKLTRKEIVQQDVIRKTLTETSSWAVSNFKLIVGALVAVLVVTTGVLLWNQYSSSRQEKMQTAFADALDIFHAPVGAEATQDQNNPIKPKYTFADDKAKYEKSLSAFQALASQYSGSKIGALSEYYAALSMNELGQNEQARSTLQSIVDQSDYIEVKDLARNTLADLDLADGKYDDAMALLRQILEQPSQDFPKEIVMLKLGRILERKGDLSAALEEYRKVTSEFPGTNSASDASTRIRRIEPRVEQAGSETPKAPEPPAQQ